MKLIGQRGKTINTIIERTGVKIDIDEEGYVSVCGTDAAGIKEAIRLIDIITNDFEVGQIIRWCCSWNQRLRSIC